MLIKEEKIQAEDNDIVSLSKLLEMYGLSIDITDIKDFRRQKTRVRFPFRLKEEVSKDQLDKRIELYLAITREIDEFTAEVVSYSLKPEDITQKKLFFAIPIAQQIAQRISAISQKIGMTPQDVSSLLVHDVFSNNLDNDWANQKGIEVDTVTDKLRELLKQLDPLISLEENISLSEMIALYFSVDIFHNEQKYVSYSQRSVELSNNKILDSLVTAGRMGADNETIYLNCFTKYYTKVIATILTTITLIETPPLKGNPELTYFAPVLLFWLMSAIMTGLSVYSHNDVDLTRRHEIAHILQNRPEFKSGLRKFKS